MKNEFVDKSNTISKVNTLLIVILWLAIGVSLLLIGAAIFMPEFGLDFETDRGVIIVEIGDLPFSQRMVVGLLFSTSLCCWIVGLLALLKMTRQFSSGRIFTLQNIYYVKVFGLALLGMALFDVFSEYLGAKYLISIGRLDATVSFDFISVLSQMDYVVSSLLILLILLICQVLRQAVELSEEAELTV